MVWSHNSSIVQPTIGLSSCNPTPLMKPVLSWYLQSSLSSFFKPYGRLIHLDIRKQRYVLNFFSQQIFKLVGHQLQFRTYPMGSQHIPQNQVLPLVVMVEKAQHKRSTWGQIREKILGLVWIVVNHQKKWIISSPLAPSSIPSGRWIPQPGELLILSLHLTISVHNGSNTTSQT